MQVSPESAGAIPGPASYGSGNSFTVTDAQVVLGRLGETGLLDGAMLLDRSRAEKAGNDLQPIEKIKVFKKERSSVQPVGAPSCGSVFKNPADTSAGTLIERAGLKGYKVGRAEISKKHANFIINTGEAKAADIESLILHIQSTVEKKFRIKLETEVKFIGTR